FHFDSVDGFVCYLAGNPYRFRQSRCGRNQLIGQVLELNFIESLKPPAFHSYCGGSAVGPQPLSWSGLDVGKPLVPDNARQAAVAGVSPAWFLFTITRIAA